MMLQVTSSFLSPLHTYFRPNVLLVAGRLGVTTRWRGPLVPLWPILLWLVALERLVEKLTCSLPPCFRHLCVHRRGARSGCHVCGGHRGAHRGPAHLPAGQRGAGAGGGGHVHPQRERGRGGRGQREWGHTSRHHWAGGWGSCMLRLADGVDSMASVYQLLIFTRLPDLSCGESRSIVDQGIMRFVWTGRLRIQWTILPCSTQEPELKHDRSEAEHPENSYTIEKLVQSALSVGACGCLFRVL
jgi:hypothetical protein